MLLLMKQDILFRHLWIDLFLMNDNILGLPDKQQRNNILAKQLFPFTGLLAMK